MEIRSKIADPILAYKEIQQPRLNHKLTLAAEKIMKLEPKFFLGEANLFKYDENEHSIALSAPFQELLKLLVQLEELDPQALNAQTFSELNAVFQKPQGHQGGLLRKEGTERWHLNDNPTKQQYKQIFDQLFTQLKLVEAKSIQNDIIVDHGIIFGARVERMEQRINQTLDYLKKNLKVKEHLFLKGSNRKLMQTELEYLKTKLETLQGDQKEYWTEVFNDPEQAIEANAFSCLWRCLAPQDIQELMEEKLICIKSTRMGCSYNQNQGHRPTTESTIEDCMSFFENNDKRSFFAVIEQPYVRLVDQHRFSILSKAKQCNLEELAERINNTTFNYAFVTPNIVPLISVVLDEMARSVYQLNETLKYIGAKAS